MIVTLYFSDNQASLHPRTDLRDNLSLPSTEKAETMSSHASGGRNGSRPDEMNEIDQAPHKDIGKGHSLVDKKCIPVPLTELNVTECEEHVNEEELFRPSEDVFFKLETTAFAADSVENSSCGSFSEQTNDSNLYAGNFSPSPSPGSAENNVLNIKSANSEISPGSHDQSPSQSTVNVDILSSEQTNCDNNSPNPTVDTSVITHHNGDYDSATCADR